MIMKTTRLQLSLLALFLGCASLQAQYKWADPLKQDSYARLPQRAEDKVRKPLWDLSRQSAGLSVAFRSNASEIKVRYVVKGGLSMPHMPATGVSGIDLYATDNNGQERWCAGNYSMGDTIVYNFRGLSYAAKSGNGFEYQPAAIQQCIMDGDRCSCRRFFPFSSGFTRKASGHIRHFHCARSLCFASWHGMGQYTEPEVGTSGHQSGVLRQRKTGRSTLRSSVRDRCTAIYH